METIINLILTYKYLIILPIGIIEGPFLAVLLGYFVHAGYLDPSITFVILLIADIGPDFFYWRIGHYGNRKILESKYFSKSTTAPTNLKILENMWHNHTKKTMFFGKIAYGISVPIIISAGVAKLSLRKFFLASLPVGIFQVSVLLFIGYHLGTSYELARKYIAYPGIVVAVIILVALLVYVFVAKQAAQSFNKTSHED